MPKPVSTYTWDSNGTRVVAVSGTHATDGFALEEIPDSAEFNGMFALNSQWQVWGNEGTSAFSETAHIVETNATGIATIPRGEFGLATVGAGDVYGLRAQGSVTLGGSGLQAIGGLAYAGVTATGGATGNGVTGTGGATSGIGVAGQGTGASAGVGGIGGPTGSGVTGACGSSGSASRAGVVGVGVLTRPGVLGTGGATGNGVEGVGGASGGAGVTGTAVQSSASGVIGYSAASGTSTAAAVYGIGLNASMGVYGLGADGYGVVASSDTSSPVSSAFRMIPQNDDPSVLQNGDMWANSTTGELRVRIDTVSKTVWGTGGGLAHAASISSTGSNNDAATWTTIATAVLQPPYDVKLAARTAIVQCSAEIGASGITVHTSFDVQIYDSTAGAVVFSRTYDHPAAVAGSVYDRSIFRSVQYIVPATGNRTFYLQFRRIGAGGTGIQARDASLVIRGLF